MAYPNMGTPVHDTYMMLPSLALPKSGIRVEDYIFLSACKTSSPDIKFSNAFIKFISQYFAFVNLFRQKISLTASFIFFIIYKEPNAIITSSLPESPFAFFKASKFSFSA